MEVLGSRCAKHSKPHTHFEALVLLFKMGMGFARFGATVAEKFERIVEVGGRIAQTSTIRAPPPLLDTTGTTLFFLQRFQEIFYRDRQDPGGIFDTVLFRFFQPASCVWGGFSPGYFATRLIALLARGLCPRSTGSHTQLFVNSNAAF